MIISNYLERVSEHYSSGHATEHTYRGDLAELVKSLMPGINITNEPSNVTDCGNPDYVITRNKIPVGFIEAKDLGKDLNSQQYKEQFGRYRKALDNLIITDYIWFQFFQSDELVHEIRIAEIDGKSIKPLPDNFAQFSNLIKDFCTFVAQTIKSPETLAEMMAGKARLLENILENAITSDEEREDNSVLKQQYETFKNILIHDLSPQGFADIYAQTLAYGMFAARLHDKTLDTFSRQEAAELIPKSNPFLRKLFSHVAGIDIDERIITTVDNLADVFRATNVEALLKNFGKSTQTQDPIIHFYETFLAKYDPKLRKARGVWYTPEPVVSFIVRSVDEILKTEFGLKDGLADTSKTTIKVKTDHIDRRTKSGYVEQTKEVHKVQVLDPATGTGTFLAEVVKHIYSKKFKAMQGAWSGYVEEHLIPRLNGFELLMASYSMAHLKMDMLLRETGYQSQKNPRFNIFLTNSLEEHHPDTGTLFSSWLSTEANEANNVKRDTPVMVVMGNPPYSSTSSNQGDWIKELIKKYRQGLNERKVNIDDDYIKFIRYAHHLIMKNGEGVLAYISNNSFLDGITTRQMRASILEDFDKIYILDLHGDVKKQVSIVDENVFDIQQGVSINIFVKRRVSKKKMAEFNYFDLYGKRKEKYDFLLKNKIGSVGWERPKLNEEYMFFSTMSNINIEKYLEGFKITDLFLKYSSGIQTKNDKLLIHYNKDDLKKIVKDLKECSESEFKNIYKIKKEGAWKVANAIRDANHNKIYITPIQYRPFDYRYTAITNLSNGVCGRPRFSTTQHFLEHENIGLICNRQCVGDEFSFIGVSNCVTAHGTFYLGNRGQDYLMPLYIYPPKDSQIELENAGLGKANLSDKIIAKFSDILKIDYTYKADPENKKLTPLRILHYVLAVLSSPKYRAKYNDFLKMDFPRVPYPKNKETFFKLVNQGSKLRLLQLLESDDLENFISSYPVDGCNEVDNKINDKDWEIYDKERQLGRIWINKQQFFQGIPLKVWKFNIGGYKPAQKWLKDRRGRTLSFDDILHYQKIIVALNETDRITQEIDKIDFD